jgi:putative aldouronate transport system permease protein
MRAPELLNRKNQILRYWPLYTMMIPGLAYLIINNYFPMFGLVIAFKRINFRLGILGSPWIGLENFKFLFNSPDAWIITRNTVLYNLVFIAVNTVAGIVFALALNEIKSPFTKGVYQNLILLPYLVSMIMVAYLVYAFLAMDTGLVNKSVLKPLGPAIQSIIRPGHLPRRKG